MHIDPYRIKALLIGLILIISCEGPHFEEESVHKQNIQLASKRDFLVSSVQDENVLYAEKFTNFNFLKEDLVVNSKAYLNENFSFYLPIKNEGKFSSFEIKIFTEYNSNVFRTENINDESITFIEFNKENIRFDLLERIETLEIEIIGFDKNEIESKGSFYSIKFVPEYEENFELVIKGTYHYPGDCAGDLCFKPRKEQYNVLYNVNLSKTKIPFALNFNLNSTPNLNQNLPPYYKNKFKYFKLEEVIVIPNSITNYIKTSLNKSNKNLRVESLNN